MEQGLLLPNRVQLSRAHGQGVLWDPGGEQGEGGISNRFEDTSEQRRDPLHWCIQLPHSGDLWQRLHPRGMGMG